jgi:hypothetical protein
MKLSSTNHQGRIAGASGAGRGFSLVEIIVVVGLLSVIMIGLLMMFNQTQQAFRGSMTQVDVLESGRAATELIGRELEQITAGGGDSVNLYMFNYSSLPQDLPPLAPIPNPDKRTNVLEEIFFLTRENQQWSGTAYHVSTNATNFGTLYRYTTNCPVSRDPYDLFKGYTTTPLSEWTRVMGGVVHFKLRAFTNGVWVTWGNTNNVVVNANFSGGEPMSYRFTSNAVPDAVEFELGILEDRAVDRFKTIPDPDFAQKYLQRQAAAVHLFRQRVAIRNADLNAYVLSP